MSSGVIIPVAGCASACPGAAYVMRGASALPSDDQGQCEKPQKVRR